jgi:hypothetical protein
METCITTITFHIPVQDAHAMEIPQALKDLLGQRFGMRRFKSKVRVAQDPGQVMIHVFQHHIDGPLRYQDLLEQNNPFVPEFLQ